MTTILKQNRAHYPPSVRPALVEGKMGNELFFTLGTKNCSRSRLPGGGCDFCGLNLLDGEHPPLSVSEAKKQMRAFFEKLPEGERSEILKLSLIGMTDSLLNPKTVEPSALINIAESIPKFLPNILEASIESRADMVDIRALETATAFFDKLSKALKVPALAKEIAIGIETASEEVRNKANKGISNKQIKDLAMALGQLGWNLRGYFIYNLLERDDNIGALIRAVDFMARLEEKTKVNASILILRSYVPEGKESIELFRGFKDVPDGTALSDLREAAIYAKQKGVKFEIDSTSEDQKATAAGLLSREYSEALVRYNIAFDPDELRIAK